MTQRRLSLGLDFIACAAGVALVGALLAKAVPPSPMILIAAMVLPMLPALRHRGGATLDERMAGRIFEGALWDMAAADTPSEIEWLLRHGFEPYHHSFQGTVFMRREHRGRADS